MKFEEISQATIPSLFLKRVKESPKGIAFRYKNLGIYKEVTWEQYWQQVEDLAFGLLELGLKPGDRVAIMGDPCPEWLYADLAVLCTRGIDYGIYTNSSAPEFEHVMKTGGARFFIAQNQEYVDKILPIAERLPSLVRIILIDTSVMFMYEDSRLISFLEVQQLGRQRKAKFPRQLSELMEQGNPHEPAFLFLSSGTSGLPKPAILSHHNLLTGMVWAVGEIFPDLRIHEHRGIVHLNLSHIVERGMVSYCPLVYSYIPHIGESLQYMQETLYEIQPTFIYSVPRVWGKIAAQAIVSIEGSSRVKRFTYRLAMNLSQRMMQKSREGKNHSLKWQILNWIAVQISFRYILQKLGLCKVKYAFSTGAPLAVSTQMLWRTWGIDLVNSCVATEAGGIICSEHPGTSKIGTVGEPTSVNKIRLAEDGEVMFSGPGVFLGYWNDGRATAEGLKDGWFCTGDIGEYTKDGDLKLIDRKKDIMATAEEKNITPSPIETALKTSPYISEAVLIAEARKFPSALIEIDFETVSEWARRNKIFYTGFTSLATHPKTHELIAGEVEKTNQSFSGVEQVKKFRVLPRELDPEEGDITATRKIRRTEVYKSFRDLIEEMYTTKEAEL